MHYASIHCRSGSGPHWFADMSVPSIHRPGSLDEERKDGFFRMRIDLGAGELMCSLTDLFPVCSSFPGALHVVPERPCRGRIGNEAGGRHVDPFQVSPDIRDDRGPPANHRLDETQGRPFRSRGHHEQVIVGPDRDNVADVPTRLDLVSMPRDDGGTEQDSTVSVWNVIRHDVAP
jgi:hypothetical protein